MGQLLPNIKNVTKLLNEGSKKSKILCDLDDVILDSTSRFIEEVNRRYGLQASLRDIPDVEFREFSCKYGIPAKELYELYDRLLCNQDFAMSIPEMQGASEYLKRIKKTHPKLDIQIVTGRPHKGKSYAERRLSKVRINYDGLFLTNQDAETSLNADTVKTKDGLVKKLNPDVVIEDSPRLIPQTLNRALGGHLYVVLFERPWTRDFLRKKGMERDIGRSNHVEIVGEPYWKNAYQFIENALKLGR